MLKSQLRIATTRGKSRQNRIWFPWTDYLNNEMKEIEKFVNNNEEYQKQLDTLTDKIIENKEKLEDTIKGLPKDKKKQINIALMQFQLDSMNKEDQEDQENNLNT